KMLDECLSQAVFDKSLQRRKKQASNRKKSQLPLEAGYIRVYQGYVHAVRLTVNCWGSHDHFDRPLNAVINVICCADSLATVCVDRATLCSNVWQGYLRCVTVVEC